VGAGAVVGAAAAGLVGAAAGAVVGAAAAGLVGSAGLAGAAVGAGAVVGAGAAVGDAGGPPQAASSGNGTVPSAWRARRRENRLNMVNPPELQTGTGIANRLVVRRPSEPDQDPMSLLGFELVAIVARPPR
jgi:hypothetical protein